MQPIVGILLVSSLSRLALCSRLHSSAGAVQVQRAGDRAISKVVRLLQQMLDKSKQDGEDERKLFAKHKCYCDANKEAKTSSVASLTEQIGLLGSTIDELKASNSILSQEVADLNKSMEENVQQQNKSVTLRQEENRQYLLFAGDMNVSIQQLVDAVNELAEVGADQSLTTARGHTQYVANYDAMVSLRSSVKKALVAASAFVPDSQAKKVSAFMQLKQPFTATYSAQAGEVVGILTFMREKFRAYLAHATTKEEAAQTAHDKLMQVLQDAYADMDTSRSAKQLELGSNDGSLSQAKTNLGLAEKDKEDAETFLGKLSQFCKETAEQYSERFQLRATEEAALSQAISILNSDAAFESFGKVSAPVEAAVPVAPALVQLGARESPSWEIRRQQATKVLRDAAKGKSWPGLSNIAALLQAENPFATVLQAIEKMLALISDEEDADQEKFVWCNGERSKKNQELIDLNSTISGLKIAISGLHSDIDNEVDGLRVTIKQTEEALLQNTEDQTSKTAVRKEENLKYQRNVKNMVEATDLLQKAVKVLKAYYEGVLKMDTSSFLQHEKKRAALLQSGSRAKEEPRPWDLAGDSYEGQSTDGVSAVKMVVFILNETKKEETLAHEAEGQAQRTYEGEMNSLKVSQKENEETLAAKQLLLAQKEEELLGKQEDLKDTVAVQQSTLAYLEKIKPGCDFIVDNLAQRKLDRRTESQALSNATSALKAAPAYVVAVAEAHNESLGDCKLICVPNEDHVKCKACMADTSVPGYCAGHPGTAGC